MSGRKKSGGVFIGVSSILVIFIVLCLTTFAALSLTSASADAKMAARAAQATSEYFAADAQAVAKLAQLDQVVKTGNLSAAQLGSLFEDLQISEEGGVVRVSYQVQVNDQQDLQVSLNYTGETYEIINWKVVSTQEWQGDDTIDLWDGGGDMAGLPPGI